jgi:hypothetical protein
MANTIFQLRRNAVSGIRPTTSTLSSGELAFNTTDGILFSANITNIFEIGGNLTSTAIGNSTSRFIVNTTAVAIGNSQGLIANGSTGTASQVLTSNGSGVYWSSSGSGSGSVNTADQYTWSNTQTFSNTITFSQVINGTANNANNLNGQPASYYTNATNITTGTLPYAQLGANVVNTSAAFTITGVQTFQANLIVGNSTINVATTNSSITINAGNTAVLNGSSLAVGNATVNAVVNTTGFFVNGSAVYTNATNITTGTLPYAQLGANVVNTSAAFTITGVYTYNANITFGSSSAIIANGSFGTAGQLLTSNGTGMYWSTVSSGGGGGSGGGSANFNTNNNTAIGFAANTTLQAAYTAPATAGIRYIIYSIQVTNIGTANATISGSFNGTTYANIAFAQSVPVPISSSVEMLKKPKIMQPSDVLRLQASADTTLHATISYETQTSAVLFGTGVAVTSAATYTDLYTATGVCVVESVLLTNYDTAYDAKARVVWTDSSNVIQGYYCYDMIIPQGATVEVLEASKGLPNGYKIRVYGNVANRLQAIIAGKVSA